MQKEKFTPWRRDYAVLPTVTVYSIAQRKSEINNLICSWRTGDLQGDQMNQLQMEPARKMWEDASRVAIYN